MAAATIKTAVNVKAEFVDVLVMFHEVNFSLVVVHDQKLPAGMTTSSPTATQNATPNTRQAIRPQFTLLMDIFLPSLSFVSVVRGCDSRQVSDRHALFNLSADR
jgi:hypothetical protein